MPPAPALFSTTTLVAPSALCINSAESRATASVLPPAGNGTTSLIVRLGHASAAIAWKDVENAPTNITTESSFLMFSSIDDRGAPGPIAPLGCQIAIERIGSFSIGGRSLLPLDL